MSLSGGDLLVSGWLFLVGVSHAGEALAFELAEAHAVFGVGEVEVEYGPDEGEAAGLAGEAADDLGAAFDLGQRAFQEVGGAPASAVAQRVAQARQQPPASAGLARGAPEVRQLSY